MPRHAVDVGVRPRSRGVAAFLTLGPGQVFEKMTALASASPAFVVVRRTETILLSNVFDVAGDPVVSCGSNADDFLVVVESSVSVTGEAMRNDRAIPIGIAGQ